MTDELAIRAIVVEELAMLAGVSQSTIVGTIDIVKDLRIDSDDLSFQFIPNVELRCGVRCSYSEWRNVHTVDEVVALLARRAV